MNLIFSTTSLKNGGADQGKCGKIYSNKKWMYNEYHVPKNEDLNHAYVKMCCDTAHFSSLKFTVPHYKHHIVWGLRKNIIYV